MKFKKFYNKVQKTKAAKEIDRMCEEIDKYSENDIENAVENFIMVATQIFDEEEERQCHK